jgi:hypothetical protein
MNALPLAAAPVQTNLHCLNAIGKVIIARW